MKVKDLPWWKEYSRGDNLFNRITISELSERLTKFPLTKQLITSFSEDYIREIWLMTLTNKKFEGKLYPTEPWESLNFGILINSNNSLEEKSSIYIHECMHGIYRFSTKDEFLYAKSEEILCRYEQEFFNKNKEFSIEFFKRELDLKSKKKIKVWFR